MSFSDEDASAWNVLAAEEHLGGRSSSLGRRGHEGACRMMLCFPYIPPPIHLHWGQCHQFKVKDSTNVNWHHSLVCSLIPLCRTHLCAH